MPVAGISWWACGKSAIAHSTDIPNGTGAAVVGCSAALENNEVKVTLWPGAHVCITGEQARSLTNLDATGADAEVPTATFTGGTQRERIMFPKHSKLESLYGNCLCKSGKPPELRRLWCKMRRCAGGGVW